MRLIKMLGLAALATLAVTAYIAATASADSFCEDKGLHAGECLKPLPENTLFEGKSTNVVFLGASLTEVRKCNSELLGKVKANMGKHVSVLALIEKLIWFNCTGNCTKLTSEKLPTLVEVLALSLLAHLTEDGNGATGMTLEECTAFKLKCLYTLKEGKGLFQYEEDLLVADHVPLIRGACDIPSMFPEEEFWDAKYLITLDGTNTPVYVSSLP